MLILIIRFLFFLAMAAVGYGFGGTIQDGEYRPLWMVGLMVGAAAIIALDMMFRRKDISVLVAVFFGLLVGLVVTTLLSPVVEMSGPAGAEAKSAIKVGIAALASYLAISFILQTKADFRFIIPYIEFAKQEKGGRPLLLDTSVIIDGRIADIAETRFLSAPLVVPRFVLQELQTIADSPDRLKRNRGRRGLDILNRLQTMPGVDISVEDSSVAGAPGEAVDQLLVTLAAKTSGRIVTNDYNLNKVAKFHGVEVININDLANALKPAVLPGEELDVNILRPGQEEGQGVAYLEDGTMVVIEDGKDKIGQSATIIVTSVLQTSAGRMIFGRIGAAEAGPKARGPR